jgi:hypothetical protein
MEISKLDTKTSQTDVLLATDKGTNSSKDSSLLIIVVKLIFFISAISIFITVGTVGIHELGHSIIAAAYKCTPSTMYSLGQMPFTDIQCVEKINLNFIKLEGLISTTIISIIFFFTLKGKVRYLSLTIFSLGLIVANLDLVSLSIWKVWTIIFTFLAFCLFSLSIIMVSLLYIDKDN